MNDNSKTATDREGQKQEKYLLLTMTMTLRVTDSAALRAAAVQDFDGYADEEDEEDRETRRDITRDDAHAALSLANPGIVLADLFPDGCGLVLDERFGTGTQVDELDGDTFEQAQEAGYRMFAASKAESDTEVSLGYALHAMQELAILASLDDTEIKVIFARLAQDLVPAVRQAVSSAVRATGGPLPPADAQIRNVVMTLSAEAGPEVRRALVYAVQDAVDARGEPMGITYEQMANYLNGRGAR